MTILLDRILSRCIDDAGCLLWQGALAGGATPSMKVGRRAVNVRRLYFELKFGPIPPGSVIAVKCECRRCLRHIEPSTNSEILRSVIGRGAYSASVHGPRVAAGRRVDARYSEEVVQEILSSDETGKVLAKRLGMDYSYLLRIRRGEARKDYGNPFRGLV